MPHHLVVGGGLNIFLPTEIQRPRKNSHWKSNDLEEATLLLATVTKWTAMRAPSLKCCRRHAALLQAFFYFHKMKKLTAGSL